MFVCLGKEHIGVLENKLWSLQCVNWNKGNKRNKFLLNFFEFWIVKSNFNEFEVEH